VLEDGLVIPNGPVIPYPKPADPTKSYGLSFNEYIVYNEAQVRLRYLVQVGAELDEFF
jgi:hypothetical protein